MVELINQGVYLLEGNQITTQANGLPSPDEAREQTITYGILRAHDVDGGKGKSDQKSDRPAPPDMRGPGGMPMRGGFGGPGGGYGGRM